MIGWYLSDRSDEYIKMRALVGKEEQWFTAIDRAIERINKAMAKR